MKIAFFDSKKYDIESFTKHNEKYNYKMKFFEPKLNIDSAILAKGYDAVCIFVNDEVNKEVIDLLSEYGVKMIVLRCAGYNNVDFEAAAGKIKVTRVPAYSPYAVAEHTVALIMTLNRKIHKAYIRTRETNFTLSGLKGFDMFNKTAGIIGTGKIAKIVINILKGFGMKVLAYDPYPDMKAAEEIGYEYTDLETLYKDSDIISLHCPLTSTTKYIVNEESINKMKKGVMIVNTGRGGLINTQHLIDGLKNEKVGYAALDVYEEESDYFFEDYSSEVLTDDMLARLLTFNNVLITSHQAFLTNEALDNIAETTLNNVKEFEKGEELSNEISYVCKDGVCEIKEA